MRTHILIALFTLVVSACASKQHPTAAQAAKDQHPQEDELGFYRAYSVFQFGVFER